MSVENEFIEAIRQNPDDDTPRLVYADWLDEQDQWERAEFIRLQCELARMGRDDPRRWDLELRQHRLLRWYGWQWIPEPFNPWLRRPEFHRGFVERLALTADVFLARPDFYFQQFPLLLELELQDVDARHLPALTALPLLLKLRTLFVRRDWRGMREVRGPLRRHFGDRVKFDEH